MRHLYIFIDLSPCQESQKTDFLNSINTYIFNDSLIDFSDAVFKRDFIGINCSWVRWYHFSQEELNSDLNTYYKNYKIFKLEEVQNVENFVEFLINEISSITNIPKEKICID